MKKEALINQQLQAVFEQAAVGREPLRSETMAWELAWTSLGVDAVLGPFMTIKRRATPAARGMAGGKR